MRSSEASVGPMMQATNEARHRNYQSTPSGPQLVGPSDSRASASAGEGSFRQSRYSFVCTSIGGRLIALARANAISGLDRRYAQTTDGAIPSAVGGFVSNQVLALEVVPYYIKRSFDLLDPVDWKGTPSADFREAAGLASRNIDVLTRTVRDHIDGCVA